MKKILFLVTQSEFGGAQRYIFEIVSQLKDKYEILVAAGEGDGELFQKLKNYPVSTKELKWLKRTPSPLSLIFSTFEIFNLLRKEKPSIFFLCSTTAGLIGSLSAFLYNINKNYRLRIIYRIGGWSFLDPRPVWINKILLYLERLTAKIKDKIIVNAEADKESAIKYKICPPEKITKIYNGINPEKLQFLPKNEARKELSALLPKTDGLGLKTTLIGSIANFYKTKGLDSLIESIHILKTDSELLASGFNLLIIGEGRQRLELESLIKKYKLETTVFLLGRIPDAYKYLKAFDVFVLPSRKEGFPWVILEAMASGVPIIATKVGALPEIIEDGRDGILIEPDNQKQLAEKIFQIMKNPDYGQRLKEKAKEKIEQFSLSKMVQETEELLQ